MFAYAACYTEPRKRSPHGELSFRENESFAQADRLELASLTAQPVAFALVQQVM